MNGRLDTSMAAKPVHHCDLPAHLAWDEDVLPQDGPPALKVLTPVGSRFFCAECPKVWVCHWIPDQVGNRTVVCAHHQWIEETRKERRQRKGLKHWWQREPKCLIDEEWQGSFIGRRYCALHDVFWDDGALLCPKADELR